MNVRPGRLSFLLRVAEYRRTLFHVVDNAPGRLSVKLRCPPTLWCVYSLY